MDADRYRLLFEATVDYAVFHVSPAGMVETWNIGAERIFGYEAPEIIGRHASILFTPEDNFQGVPERELKFAMETGRAQDSRWHLRKDGSRFWANGVMVGLRDDTGSLVGLAKIVKDDTDLKQSEELLQYQLNLADAIASNAAEALFLVDSEGRTTFANPTAEAMFGWTSDELVGQFLHQKLHFGPEGIPTLLGDSPTEHVIRTDGSGGGGFVQPQGWSLGADQLFHRTDPGRREHSRRGAGGPGLDRAAAD
jgi:PAS domain S-box-containing protein